MYPIVDIDEGMVNKPLNPLHNKNAESPMVVTFEGMVNEPVKPLKL